MSFLCCLLLVSVPPTDREAILPFVTSNICLVSRHFYKAPNKGSMCFHEVETETGYHLSPILEKLQEVLRVQTQRDR